ncbi:cell division protein ZapB [Treponema sp. C6A8]|uniref:cell division protein ZapB n=1 Tax=Treponema sp. C6A8 TaxID=1410609 RepID=UPI0004859644|nr:cell division protein ZapB [Treponema sp. C6A8]
MISLDQVMLLEQKVESAVAKIQQLQAENDALRSKCSELTNALSSKSEQLSSFETDQSQIESGILKALDRLNQIENSVLKVANGQAPSTIQAKVQPTAQVQQPVQKPASTSVQQTSQPQAPLQSQPVFQQTEPVQPVNTIPQAPVSQEKPYQPAQPVQDNFFTMNEAPAPVSEAAEEEIEEENPDNLGFDIF